MLPLRIAARRAGLIDRTVPQAMEEALAHKLGVGHGARPEYHHVTDHALHFGYGAALGALYGLVSPGGRQPVLARGLTFGGLAWALGAFVVLPALGGVRSPGRSRPSEIAINLGAHLIYGLTTVLQTGELGQQNDRGPRPDAARWFSRVG